MLFVISRHPRVEPHQVGQMLGIPAIEVDTIVRSLRARGILTDPDETTVMVGKSS